MCGASELIRSHTVGLAKVRRTFLTTRTFPGDAQMASDRGYYRKSGEQQETCGCTLGGVYIDMSPSDICENGDRLCVECAIDRECGYCGATIAR